MANTASGIVETVEGLLDTEAGQRWIEGLTGHFDRLCAAAANLRKQVLRLRRRPGTAFYAAVGSLRAGSVTVDVRIGGTSCGTIKLLPGAAERNFTPRNFPGIFRGEPTDWGKPSVSAYVAEVRRRGHAGRGEAKVESALLVAMADESSATKLAALLDHQPVKLAGLPFQFPLPIVARKRVKLATRAAGHIDVVARAGHRGERLRVFEVKQERAADVGHALDQAVAYCAALRYLLVRRPATSWAALGYGAPRRTVRLEAVAFVPDTAANRATVEAAARRLAPGTPFPLFAQYFRWTGSDPADRVLEITGEQRYA